MALEEVSRVGKERERRWVEKKNGRTQTGEASKNLREFLVLAEPLASLLAAGQLGQGTASGMSV